MTSRRPIVIAGNNLTELPSGDSVAASLIANTPSGNIAATDVQAAINELDSEKLAITSIHLPFYKADGTLDTIPLTADSKLPFYLASGTASHIALTV